MQHFEQTMTVYCKSVSPNKSLCDIQNDDRRTETFGVTSVDLFHEACCLRGQRKLLFKQECKTNIKRQE